MIIDLTGDIAFDKLTQLTKAISDLKPTDKLHIYFSSEGGLVGVSEAMIDIINIHREIITITFFGEIFSAGMFIFLKTKCKKHVLPDTMGMYHYAWQEITISEGGRPGGAYDIFAVKEMKKAKKRTLEYLKTTKLTEREINSIKAGKDLYLPYERMLELL